MISFTASIRCYGRSEKSEESLSSKYFCIIVLHDCVPKQPASTSERSDSINCVTSARSEVQVIYIVYENYYNQWLIFLVIFSATVYQEVTILFALTRWTETVLYSHMFMRYSSFAHKLNLNLWMETAYEMWTDIMSC